MMLFKVLGIITAVFIVFLLSDMFGIWGIIFPLDEAGIRNMLENEYPDSDTNINFTENCTICDERGCRTYKDPCWKIRILTETDGDIQLTDILMSEGGGIIEKRSRPCTDWWCTAPSCRYTYTESSEGLSFSYTNRDCGTTELSCDAEYGRCRPCRTGDECISSIAITGANNVTHIFEVLRTGEYALIDSTEGRCKIYSRGELIFSKSMDAGSCGSMMYKNTECYNGICDFVPQFNLIQE